MNSGNPSDRDRLVLSHLGRYRLSFKEIIGHLFFGGADPQKALDRLRDAGFIDVQKGFVGNRTAYRLVARGAAAVNLNRRRGEALGPESLPAHLAILAFCFLKRRPRILLEDNDSAEIFGESPPPGRYHCLEHGSQGTRVYHLSVPGPSTPPDEVVQGTRRHIAECLKSREFRPWVNYKLYTQAILVDNPERQAEIARLIERAEYVEGKPLVRVAHVVVELVAGIETLEESLRVFTKEAQEGRSRAG